MTFSVKFLKFFFLLGKAMYKKNVSLNTTQHPKAKNYFNFFDLQIIEYRICNRSLIGMKFDCYTFLYSTKVFPLARAINLFYAVAVKCYVSLNNPVYKKRLTIRNGNSINFEGRKKGTTILNKNKIINAQLHPDRAYNRA